MVLDGGQRFHGATPADLEDSIKKVLAYGQASRVLGAGLLDTVRRLPKMSARRR